MKDIVIYRAEAQLAEQIQANRVIAYHIPLIGCDENLVKSINESRKRFDDKAIAAANDSDLYYTKSILVTTTWNKNDDVFTKAEVWPARNTPTHKPTNIEHNEKQLVGHITDCWAMTLDGLIIPDNSVMEDLPDVFHLVNGAVIYTAWRDEELIKRTDALIKQIQAGEKFVSMECMFSNFNYAVKNAEGKCHVVARDESTAWMTKHLRAYGGTGEYEGYQIGRLLRNITFSGKGYVDRPANPDSIIFDSANCFEFNNVSQENPFFQGGGVYLNNVIANENQTETIRMNEIEQLKAQLAELQAAKGALEAQLAKADIAKFETKITELETQLTSANTEIETSKKTIEELTAKCADDQKKMDEEKKAKAELEQKLAEMVQAQITANRISTLTSAGIEKEVAEKKVALYANLTDEQWTDISTDLIAAKKEDKPKEKEVPVKAEETSTEVVENTTNANDGVLNSAEVTDDTALATETEVVDEMQTLRTEMQQAIASRLGIKFPENKTE